MATWRDAAAGKSFVYVAQRGRIDGWVMQNSQWAGSFSLGSRDPAYTIAGSGDFNHTGSADILWRNPATGQTGEWLLAPA